MHELHNHPDLEDRNDRIYCCYFNTGLRIYNINDPFVPKEIAYYIPPNPKKALHGPTMDPDDPTFNLAAKSRSELIATTEDVLVDNRGYIFMDALHDGLYVLRCKV